MLAKTQLSPFHKAGPPIQQQVLDSLKTEERADRDKAQTGQEDSFSWGKVAAGVGLAAGSILGMASGASAAPLPAQIEAPEVVVLSESVERVDISRETEVECTTDFDNEEVCTTEDVAYHPVGVHAGQGVVRDLNGNLFVAPQLVTKDAPGVATINPDSVVVRGPFGSRGRLTKQRDGDYETSGSLFGYHTIDVGRNSVEVGSKGLFGSSWQVEVTTNSKGARINERFDQDWKLSGTGTATLETTGFFGGTEYKIQHQDGSSAVRKPGFFGGSEVTVTYGPNSLERRDNGWLQTRINSTQEDGETEHRVTGGFLSGTRSRTTEKEGGWTDTNGGIFGASYRYQVEGGTKAPQ